MSTLNKEVYEAFLEAGVSKETASKASASVEQIELVKRLAIVETKLDAISKMVWIVIALVLKAYLI